MRYRTSIGLEAFFKGMGPMVAVLAIWTIGNWLLTGFAVCLLGALGWVAASTRYVIEDGVLKIRMGWSRRSVRLDEIKAVQRGHRWKGETLGFGSDFVGIEYGDRVVNVSPRDIDGFVAALAEGAR